MWKLRGPALVVLLRSRCVSASLSALGASCASATATVSSSQQPTAPLAPPGPGAAGCVESRELKEFVLALDGARSRALAQALAQLGVVERPRPSRFVEPPGAPSDGTYESEGQRLAVVAQLATSSPPLVPLGQRGQVLHRIEERPRPHPIALRACGGPACPARVSPSLPPVRAVAVALAPGEQFGAPLQLDYDYWWAQVSYDRAHRCAPR
ncbi:MAG: hypothetical protein RL033_2773 [Pseudomonadota bacterium]